MFDRPRASEKEYLSLQKRNMFQVEMQYDDIVGPTEIDMTRIPEFPASAALQSIEGQNLTVSYTHLTLPTKSIV